MDAITKSLDKAFSEGSGRRLKVAMILACAGLAGCAMVKPRVITQEFAIADHCDLLGDCNYGKHP